jgi:hypothetical protein
MQDKHNGDISVVRKMGNFTFAPLVTAELRLLAELDILFLRPSRPGELVTHGGDLDNRIKRLFDSLRVPQKNQIDKESPSADEDPFFCLLEDDALVSAFSVTSDQLLGFPPEDKDHVEIVITVRTKATEGTFGNLSLSV